jgi:hypothetical protein
MNDRIRELASVAWAAQTKLNEDLLSDFVKLIVQECVQELEVSKKCDPYNGNLFDCEYNTCINEQITMLKQHFGIEE